MSLQGEDCKELLPVVLRINNASAKCAVARTTPNRSLQCERWSIGRLSFGRLSFGRLSFGRLSFVLGSMEMMRMQCFTVLLRFNVLRCTCPFCRDHACRMGAGCLTAPTAPVGADAGAEGSCRLIVAAL